MARATVEDPLKVFRFKIVVDGFQRAGAAEFGPLDRNTEMIKYREGGFNDTVQKSPGLTEFPDVTYKRGLLVGSSRGGDDDFDTWAQQTFNTAAQGNADKPRKDLTTNQYRANNTIGRAWNLFECLPAGYKPASTMKADANENSYEELKISYEGWTKIL